MLAGNRDLESNFSHPESTGDLAGVNSKTAKAANPAAAGEADMSTIPATQSGGTTAPENVPPVASSQTYSPRPDWGTALYESAKHYLANGHCVLPAGAHKGPDLSEWKLYQTQFPTQDEIRQWFSSASIYGLGIVCGKI